MTGRRGDWPERLDAVVEAARHRPFAWGTHDCITFAAACIQAVTGVCSIAALQPWHDWHEARAVIRYLDGRQRLRMAIGRIMADHGWPEIAPRQAGRGDLSVAAGDKGIFAAICLGPVLAAPGEEGLALVPASRAIAAWRIG